jgi:peptidoglycan/xylan/chitin deacetylase (PgdA/CDA1 family)
VALTFDLCEAKGEVAGYDGAVVDSLRSAEAPATFFMGGRWAQSHTDRAMQLLADPMFEVGNHTYDHANLDHADAAKVADELAKTESVLSELRARVKNECPSALPVAQSHLFRFPYGSCSPQSLAAVTGMGETPIQWDVVSGDPSGIAAAPMAKAVLAEVKPGSIIVMHANGRGKHTAEALHMIIPKLRAEGYRFVTVSELLQAGTAQTASACFVEHPGDTARYDHPKTKSIKAQVPDAHAAASPAAGKGAGIVPAPHSQNL